MQHKVNGFVSETIALLHWGLKKNKGLIAWKRFIYGEINQCMELFQRN